MTHPRHPARLSVLSAGSSNALWGEAFSPDSKLLAAAYGGGAALWDVARPARPRLLTVLDAHVGQVTSSDIAFSPNGRLLALASGNGQITIWNVTRPARGFPAATVSGPKGAGWLTALAFAPGSRLLAGVTTSGTGAGVQPGPPRPPGPDRHPPQPGHAGPVSRRRRRHDRGAPPAAPAATSPITQSASRRTAAP